MNARFTARATRVLRDALASTVFAAMVVSCQDDSAKLTGLGEPMIVPSAQFIQGPMPNGDGGPGDAIVISNFGYQSTTVPAGDAAKSISGDVSDNAVAVGVALADLGGGYWVLPAGSPDTTTPGQLTFSIKAGFSTDISPGNHDLLFAGISGSGQAGPQTPLTFCFGSITPDNGHACAPKNPLPDTVYSLAWDANFDLDLHVILPDGTDINPKSPLAGPLDAGEPLEDDPHIDRDSLRGCVADGLRREDVIFQDPPPKGAYLIYADPFAACGQPATRFTFTVYHPSGQCPTCVMVADPSETKSGELLGSQVTGGASTGLFVEQLNVN